MTEIKSKVITDISEKGFLQKDNRLNRMIKGINVYLIEKRYSSEMEHVMPLGKYHSDWERMYRTFVMSCELLNKDPLTRRAVILNTSHYDKVFPCFLSMHILANEIEGHDMIVHQRAMDIEKLDDDIVFFEHVMWKVYKRTGLNINRLRIIVNTMHVSEL